MLEKWLADPASVSATALLLAAIYALYKGLIVPKWIYDATLQRCDKLEAQRDKLLDLALHNTHVTESALTVAAKQVGT